MARLESSRGYVGAVDHPETGDLIQLNESHPADVAATVANAYDYLTVADDETESDSADTDKSAPDTADNAEAETFRCGVNDCSRTVDSADAVCWQH